MLISALLRYILLYPYILLCAFITYYIYKEEKPFYTPVYVSKNEENKDHTTKDKKINIHDEFPCFSKLDRPLNVIKLFLGLVFLGIPRLLINLFLAWRIKVNIIKYLKSKNSEGNN